MGVGGGKMGWRWKRPRLVTLPLVTVEGPLWRRSLAAAISVHLASAVPWRGGALGACQVRLPVPVVRWRFFSGTRVAGQRDCPIRLVDVFLWRCKQNDYQSVCWLPVDGRRRLSL